MKPFITLTFCAIVFGAFAIAQAAPEPVATQSKPEPRPDSVSFALLTGESFSWTGLTGGLHIGGALNYFDFDHRDVFVDTVQQFNEAFGDDFGTFDDFGTIEFEIRHKTMTEGSVMGGGQIGGNFQFGHFVVGVEGDFDRLAPHVERHIGMDDFVTWDPDDFIEADTRLLDWRAAESTWNASVRGKIGWAHGPLLYYATGGVAWSDLIVRASETASTVFLIDEGGEAPSGEGFVPFASTSTRVFRQRDSDTLCGWTAGGGIDLALTDVLTIALEYRHTDFGDHTFHFSTESDLSSDGPIFSDNTRMNLSSDQVTIRVNLILSRFFFGHH